MEIHYLTYRQIDKTKWDACIDASPNGLIYAYTFYLDAMAKNWDALVLTAGDGDKYETVMPLTWNKKFGIRYLYQPPLAACLGVFGKSVTAATVNSFLKAIPAAFRYWDMYFNAGNFFKLEDFDLYQRMNYVLNLNNSYEHLYAAYRDNIKRNIKKAAQFKVTVKKNIDIQNVMALAKEQLSHFSEIDENDLVCFEKLYRLLYQKEKAITYGVHTHEGALIAAAVFFFSYNRAYYILAGNHPNGKTLGASHTLINAFIKDHAGKNLLLDFEGSDKSSLAFFYSSFGAVQERYPGLKLNRLPFFMKWFKQ